MVREDFKTFPLGSDITIDTYNIQCLSGWIQALDDLSLTLDVGYRGRLIISYDHILSCDFMEKEINV